MSNLNFRMYCNNFHQVLTIECKLNHNSHWCIQAEQFEIKK